MSGIFSFFSGVFSLGAGMGLALKELNNNEIEWENNIAAGYNYAAQSKYDFDSGKLYINFDIEAIIQEIQNDYPKMNEFCAREIAEASVAKRMLEEETKYKYKPSENCKFFNLEKYARNEFRKEMKE